MKTTKDKIQEIRDATKLVASRFFDADFARDATLKYMGALTPEAVTGMLDDIGTLEARCAELEALVRAHEFTRDELKRENGWKSSMLDRARDSVEDMFDGYITEKQFEKAREFLSDLSKGPGNE